MEKFAAQIEQNMAFMLGGDLKKALGKDEAISHLSKACDYLDNAGRKVKAAEVRDIISKAASIDDTDIEVQ